MGRRCGDQPPGLIDALRRRDVGSVVQLTSSQFTDGAQRLTSRLDEIGMWS